MKANAVIPANAVTMAGSGQPVTTSLQIAEVFNKNHKDVMKRIRTLECSEDFTERNFAPSGYIDPTGRKLSAYEITKDGFVLLVMGFTGKQAMQFKLAYIEAFNRMERMLKTGGGVLSDIENAITNKISQMTPLEQAKLLVAMESGRFMQSIAKLAEPKPLRLSAPKATPAGLSGYNVTGLRRMLRDMGVRKAWVASARRDVLITTILHQGANHA